MFITFSFAEYNINSLPIVIQKWSTGKTFSDDFFNRDRYRIEDIRNI